MQEFFWTLSTQKQPSALWVGLGASKALSASCYRRNMKENEELALEMSENCYRISTWDFLKIDQGK